MIFPLCSMYYYMMFVCMYRELGRGDDTKAVILETTLMVRKILVMEACLVGIGFET